MGPWSNRNGAVGADPLESPNRVGSVRAVDQPDAKHEDRMRLRSSTMLRRPAGSAEAATPVPATPPRTVAALDAAPHATVDVASVDQIAQSKEALQRVVAELSHDLRQPLTSLNMNIQSAVRLLQQPNPRVSAALDALSDCLDTERDMVELLAYAKRRALALSSRNSLFPLNELARDILLTVQSVEPR